MATLQVKGLDDNLYFALRSRARRDNRSISQEVVTIIEDFLSHPGKHSKDTTRAFLELAGSWEDDRTAQHIAGEIRKNRRTGRRFA